MGAPPERGQEVPYSFRMPDEKTGTAVFDRSEYQLAAGRLFLLKIVTDKVVVKQIDNDLSGIDPTTADFPAVGRADPVNKAFFETAAGR